MTTTPSHSRIRGMVRNWLGALSSRRRARRCISKERQWSCVLVAEKLAVNPNPFPKLARLWGGVGAMPILTHSLSHLLCASKGKGRDLIHHLKSNGHGHRLFFLKPGRVCWWQCSCLHLHCPTCHLHQRRNRERGREMPGQKKVIVTMSIPTPKNKTEHTHKNKKQARQHEKSK